MTRRPDLETRLDSLPGVTWTYQRALPVADLDLPASADLQYRLTDVDQPTVDRYADDMARGDRFPALLVREVRGRRWLIGGNHRRAAAAQAGIATLAAYVVGCSPAQARQLAYEDNRTHGLPLKPTERAELGARLVLLDGMTLAEAGAVVGAGTGQIQQAVDGARANRRAEDLGLPAAFAGLNPWNRGWLQRIDDDGLFAETARVVLSTGMGGASIQGLVARLRDADDLDDAFDRLDAIAAARQGHSSGRGSRRNDLTRLADHIFALLDVDPAKAAGSVRDGDEQLWRDRLKRTARHLMAVDEAIAARANKAEAAA